MSQSPLRISIYRRLAITGRHDFPYCRHRLPAARVIQRDGI